MIVLTRVMASGVFDVLHAGHLSYLEQAKAMGDELVVVVACDETASRRKHVPVIPEAMRLRLVNALKPVDLAVLGKSGDMFATVAEIHPDIIVLGFDQTFDEEKLRRDLDDRGLGGVKVARATECAEDLNATRRIIKKIVEDHGGMQ